MLPVCSGRLGTFGFEREGPALGSTHPAALGAITPQCATIETKQIREVADHWVGGRELQAGCGISCLTGHGLAFCPAKPKNRLPSCYDQFVSRFVPGGIACGLQERTAIWRPRPTYRRP